MNAAVGSAGARTDNRQCLWSQAIDPFAGSNRLTGIGVGTHRRPVAFFFYFLVRDRAFYDQHKGIEQALLCFVKKLHEFVPVLVGEYRIVQMYLRQSRNRSE